MPRLRLPCWVACTLAATLTGLQGPSAAPRPAEPKNLSGQLPDGALWRARIPAHWNGTLLLYAHGYLPDVRPPRLAPADLESLLLNQGYALAASSYAHGGWSVADAVPDQLATLTELNKVAAQPRRTIAWGESMGGLITLALAEQPTPHISAALTACGSIAGSLGMMNMALDGAFAFTTLLADPNSDIKIVNTADDRANAARVPRVLSQALTTPQGRARIALSGALAGLPGWTQPGAPQPAPTDDEAQLDQLAASFVPGVFLPRADQERLAGGVASWNDGIDYRAQLERTGRRSWVEGFYRRAGLDLEADLNTLNQTPRIAANAQAVAYMAAHYVPTAAPTVPVLSYQTIGDGLTSPVFQGAYAQQVILNNRQANFSAAWLNAAGHCTFTPAEHLAALHALEARLQSGHWQTQPGQLNTMVAHSGEPGGRFISFTPPPFTRACFAPLSVHGSGNTTTVVCR